MFPLIAGDGGFRVNVTGNTDLAGAVIASLNRDTAGAHQAAEKIDTRALEEEVAANQGIKQGAFNTAVLYADEAYKRMFIENIRIGRVVVERDEYGEVTDTGFVGLTTAEKEAALEAAADGKVHAATNGIFNNEEAAAKYAAQLLHY